MAARRYELTDTQWDRIKDLIPRAKTGRPPKDDRMVLNKLKVFRRVATRYDKLAVSFPAFVHLASIWILLK